MSIRGISRRGLMLAAAATVATGPARAVERSAVLRVGNQKGGLRSLFEASGAAKDLPYTLEWAEYGLRNGTDASRFADPFADRRAAGGSGQRA